MTSQEELQKRGLEEVVHSLNLRSEDLETIGRISGLRDDSRVESVTAVRGSTSMYKVHLRSGINVREEALKILQENGFPESRAAFSRDGEYQCTIFMKPQPRAYDLIFCGNKN